MTVRRVSFKVVALFDVGEKEYERRKHPCPAQKTLPTRADSSEAI